MEISLSHKCLHICPWLMLFSSSPVWILFIICVLCLLLFLVWVLSGLCNCSSTSAAQALSGCPGGKEHAFLIPGRWMRNRVNSLVPSYFPRKRIGILKTENKLTCLTLWQALNKMSEKLLEPEWEPGIPLPWAATSVEQYDIIFFVPEQWIQEDITQNVISVKAECSRFWSPVFCPAWW